MFALQIMMFLVQIKLVLAIFFMQFLNSEVLGVTLQQARDMNALNDLNYDESSYNSWIHGAAALGISYGSLIIIWLSIQLVIRLTGAKRAQRSSQY